MLCNEEVPVTFYLTRLAEYLQFEERSLDGAKKFIGVDDEKYERLLLDVDFKRLIELI